MEQGVYSLERDKIARPHLNVARYIPPPYSAVNLKCFKGAQIMMFMFVDRSKQVLKLAH